MGNSRHRLWHTALSPLPTLPDALHTSCEGHTMTDLLQIANMHCPTEPSQNDFFAPKMQPEEQTLLKPRDPTLGMTCALVQCIP